MENRADSSLPQHELAYILGQMQFKESCPILAKILQAEDEDVFVRHESVESLGAIGLMEYLPLLEKYKDHRFPEIA